MIEESGRVVAIEEDCLWVETVQSSTCSSCSAQKGCGQSLIAKWDGNTTFIRVLLGDHDAEDFEMHQMVTVGIPEDVVVKGSLFVYLMPLFGLLLFSVVAGGLGFTEFAVMSCALLGFLFGALIVRVHSYWRRNDIRVQPVLLNSPVSPVLIAP